MNEKNSLGLDNCFKDYENPLKLFNEWFAEAKKTEINDPNALALATSTKDGIPNVRMVLLKGFNEKGFVFYTNLNSKKSNDIKSNPWVSMCFHWKSLLRQIRIIGKVKKVSDSEADTYYNSRSYGSRIGAWASKQSMVLQNRDELDKSIDIFKKLNACFDVVYLDPMYPVIKKNVKKSGDLESVRSILEIEKIYPDENILIENFIKTDYKKLILKRPLKSKKIYSNINYQVKGKTTRFDIYL